MSIALLFPPGTDPRAPHLALPSLAAATRGANLKTTMWDLDIGGLISLLSVESLSRAGQAVRARVEGRSSTTPWVRRLAAISEYLVENALPALMTLRDKQRFYDPNQYNLARSTICDALDLVSAARPGVRYNIAPIVYDLAGVDPTKLGDLVDATSDAARNLFMDHWETDLFPQLAKSQPLLIGITITNRQQLLPGLFLARELRRRGQFVVLGGTVLTKFPQDLQQRPAFFETFADAVVLYEGETALLALTEQLAGSRDLSRVPNLLYLENGLVRATETHVEEVNQLPCPDFEGLPLHDYLAPELVLPILTGKGCYFNRCKFCDIPYINHIAKKAYRLRSPELVAEDCVTLNQRFGCRHFEITDEALSPKLLDRLADALAPHAARRFSFVGYARLEPGFTPQLCKKLADMGMKKVFFGLESGSQKTLDHMDKGIDVTDAPIVLQNCRDAGINFHIFSMIGFPEETPESARETFTFFTRNASIIDNPGNTFDIHPFGLELRTRYFSEAKSLGALIRPEALKRDFVIGLGEDHWTNQRGLTADEVKRFISASRRELRDIYVRYHNCPEHLWPGYEEYAILYSDYYAAGDFPFSTSVPGDDDPRAYRLRWSPLIWVERDAGLLSVRGRHGRARLPADIYQFFRRDVFETHAHAVSAFRRIRTDLSVSECSAVLRRITNTLIGDGLVAIDLSPPRAEQPAPGRAA